MRALLALVVVGAFSAAAGWMAGWLQKQPLRGNGGLYFLRPVEIPVPHFVQNDQRWGSNLIGQTSSSLAAEGCAVACAAMVLAARGFETDPGHLNAFLSSIPGGYTHRGWIFWEKAPEIFPGLAEKMLPHYEDAPSYFLVDWNLLRGNPVIARVRLADSTTHFVVIHGKSGSDYLITDPGRQEGRRKLSELGTPVEAIRFYQPPKIKNSTTALRPPPAWVLHPGSSGSI